MKNDQLKLISEAVKVFNGGGVVIFPTDTAFGLGCRIDNEKALERLVKIKQRSSKQAFPVLVSDIYMAEKYFASPLPVKLKNLMNKFWPGGLTIIYKANNSISSLVKGGGNNIGLRIPDNEILLRIISNIGIGIIGTSANYHGEPTPYTTSQINKELIKQVDYVIPGECYSKLSSTVIDCMQEPWIILRQGKVNVNL